MSKMSPNSNSQKSSEKAEQSEKPKAAAKIPPQVRVMIALCASPTLIVIAFLLYNLATQQWKEIGVSTIVFSLVGLFAYYLVFTGKIPFKR